MILCAFLLIFVLWYPLSSSSSILLLLLKSDCKSWWFIDCWNYFVVMSFSFSKLCWVKATMFLCSFSNSFHGKCMHVWSCIFSLVGGCKKRRPMLLSWCKFLQGCNLLCWYLLSGCNTLAIVTVFSPCLEVVGKVGVWWYFQTILFFQGHLNHDTLVPCSVDLYAMKSESCTFH